MTDRSWAPRCVKCRRNPAQDNETQTCRECENRALDAILVAAVRGLPIDMDEDGDDGKA